MKKQTIPHHSDSSKISSNKSQKKRSNRFTQHHQLQQQVLSFLYSDTNECHPNPCLNNGTCTDLVDDYNCTCLQGYVGRNCENGTYNIIFCLLQTANNIPGTRVCNQSNTMRVTNGGGTSYSYGAHAFTQPLF